MQNNPVMLLLLPFLLNAICQPALVGQTIVKSNPQTIKKLSKVNSAVKSPFTESWMKFQSVTDAYTVIGKSGHVNISELLGTSEFESYTSQVFHIDSDLNDSLYAEQWNIRQTEWSHEQISALNPSSVKVAIIDTGIDWLHEDLRNQLWINEGESVNNQLPDSSTINQADNDNNGLFDDIIGYNFLENKISNQPFDDQGHGTAVAGIIAAQSNNKKGITGFAPNAKIIILKAFDNTGNGTEIEIAKALLYAWYRKVDVVNMSFGINSVRSLLLEDILNAMEKDGILLVGSSGNNTSFDRHYPSAFESVISVGASTTFGDYATFSNYGNSVDLLAPGQEIPTTARGNTYNSFSGTSASAPHVTAALAVLKGINKDLTTTQVRSLLQETSSKIRGKSFTSRTLSGILNFKNLLQKSANNYSVGIINPAIDSWWSSESLHVSINTLSSNFKSWSLSYQKDLGSTDQWITFASDNRAKNGDVGGVLLWSEIKDAFTERDSVLSLRLSVENMNGSTVEDRRTIFRYRSALKTDYIRIEKGFEYEADNVWMESKTNHPVKVTLIVSNQTSSWSESSQSWKYLNYVKLKISGSGDYEVKAVLEDLAGDKIVLVKNVSFSNVPDFIQYDSLNLTTIPNGALYSGKTDFNQDGFDDFIVSRESDKNNYGFIYFYSGSNVSVAADSIQSIQVPVDVVKFQSKWYFLTVSLGRTYLFASSDSVSFPSAQVWSSQPNTTFWGAKLFVSNQSLQMIYRDASDYRLGIFNNSADNLLPVKKFSYPFDALDGPARAKLVRYNDQNDNQVFVADQYGNILVYSLTQSGDSTLVFGDALPLYNSSEFIEAGDLTGDGLDELLVLSSDLTYNDYRYNEPYPTRWNFRVYSFINGKDSVIYEKWFTNFYGLFGLKNQLSLKEINGSKYLLLGLTPHQYILKWSSTGSTFETESVLRNVSSWGSLAEVKTVSGNYDWILNGGKNLSAWSKLGQTDTEAEIESFAQLTDSTGFIKVKTTIPHLNLFARTNSNLNYGLKSSTANTDSVLIKLKPDNHKTDYLISTRNYPHLHHNSKNQIDIQMFNKGSYTAEYADGIIVIRSENPIRFDKEAEVLFQVHNLTPNTILADESKRTIVVDFGSGFSGWFKIPQLTDINNRTLIRQTDSVFVPVHLNQSGKFYITHFSVQSEYQVTVYFNRNINQSSLASLTLKTFPEHSLNYSVTSSGNSLTIKNTNRPWGSIGGPITLEFNGIRDSDNNDISSPGNQVGIELPGTSLSEVIAYPNPYVIGDGKLLSFGNMINKATITIYDMNMRLKRVLKKDSQGSILLFDGKSDNGGFLSTGIYFYVAEDDAGNRKTDKIVIVR